MTNPKTHDYSTLAMQGANLKHGGNVYATAKKLNLLPSEIIDASASLVQLYTGWIYKGPQLVPDILQGILKQLNNHQLSNIKEAIGSNLKWVE